MTTTTSSSSSWALIRFVLLSFAVACCFLPETAHAVGNFYTDFNITWGADKVKIFDNGAVSLTMSLDNTSGCAFVTYDEFLFGKIDMQMKLVPGNSAGTVTTLYLSALGEWHDEIDFEFLGNLTGEPYTVHTNIFTLGKGDKEMQFHLWFDPTSDFHTYTILWNPQNVIWSIDGIPIRIFRNNEAMGIAFPKDQPMKLYSSLWNADDWATQGGLIKTDWTLAPFTASYRNYTADACAVKWGIPHCTSYNWYALHLSPEDRGKMEWVQSNYLIYDYCTDYKRFPQGLPPDCSSYVLH